MKNVLLTTVLSLMMCMGVFAQDYFNAPKANEKVLGTITLTQSMYYNKQINIGHHLEATKDDWYRSLKEKAIQEYPNRAVEIRGMTLGPFSATNKYGDWYDGPAIGKVVVLNDPETLSQALKKALRNVREGSRLAIDQVSVPNSMDRNDFKDQIIDVLLDGGYKVLAKEYLEKLYREQQDQQSGIYNEKTTVQENNFSAVGYFINVKVTETSIRVQVVNVSTGEYEGNATVNF